MACPILSVFPLTVSHSHKQMLMLPKKGPYGTIWCARTGRCRTRARSVPSARSEKREARGSFRSGSEGRDRGHGGRELGRGRKSLLRIAGDRPEEKPVPLLARCGRQGDRSRHQRFGNPPAEHLEKDEAGGVEA